MEILSELVNLGNGSAAHGDKLAADICREAIQEIERLRMENTDYFRRLRETAQVIIEAIGSIGPENAADASRRAVAEIDRLRKQIDKLPRTKDCVRWYGQPVWCITCDGGVISNEMFGEFRYTYSIFVEEVGVKEWQAVFPIAHGLMSPVRYCYSTREAVEAAKGK